MKYIVLLLLLFTSLLSRENPFDAPYDRPQIEQESIPILNIKTSNVYASLINDTKNIHLKREKDKKPKIIKIKDINKTPTKVENNISKPIKIVEDKKRTFLVEPIIINEKPIIEKKEVKKKQKYIKKYKKRLKKKVHRKKFKTIFSQYFLTVKSNGKVLKLYTKDRFLCSKRYKNPDRVFFDFKGLQYFKTKSLTLNKTKIKFGSHHKFYRITIYSKKNHHIKKTKYGYLIYL